MVTELNFIILELISEIPELIILELISEIPVLELPNRIVFWISSVLVFVENRTITESLGLPHRNVFGSCFGDFDGESTEP